VVAANAELARRFPNDPRYQMDLYGAHLNLGGLHQEAGRPGDAADSHRAALVVAEQLNGRYPAVPEYAAARAGVLGNLAGLRNKAKDYAEAKRLLADARRFADAATKAEPDNPRHRQTDRNLRLETARALVGLGDHAGGADEAERAASLKVDPGLDAYDAAGLIARCVPLPERDAAVPAGDRVALADRYADRAVALLRQAVAGGEKLDAAELERDEAFVLLRGRPAFQKLLAELRR
jgi:hypothetical protein